MVRDMKKSTLHYGWIICLGCTILIVCTMGLAANAGFSVYLPYITEYGGYGHAGTSTIITVRSLFTLFGMAAVTQFYKKTDIRLGVTCALIVTAMAFVCYALAENLFMYYVGAALAGLGYGLGSIIPVAILINRWFIERRALAIGICSSGTGLATLIFPRIITNMVENIGLRGAFMLEAGFILLVAILIFSVLRNQPKEKGCLPYGETVEKEKTQKTNKCVPKRNIYPVEWGIMSIGMACIGAVAILGTSNMSLLFRTAGQDSYTVSTAISLLGIMLIVSKLVFGNAMDHIGTYRSNYIFAAIAFAGLLLSCSVNKTGTAGMFVSVVLMGFGLPLATVGLPIWASDFSTEATYGSVLKRMQIAYQMGGLLLSPVCGTLADMTGSYAPTYFMFAVFVVITLIIVQTMYKRIL